MAEPKRAWYETSKIRRQFEERIGHSLNNEEWRSLVTGLEEKLQGESGQKPFGVAEGGQEMYVDWASTLPEQKK